MTATNQMSHTAGPWQRRSIPGHLFELHNNAGHVVLRIRGGMMPMLADAKVLEAAPEMLDLLQSIEGFCPADWQDRIRAIVAKVSA